MRRIRVECNLTMLTPSEREGLLDILRLMPVKDVLALAETVSARLISVQSLHEAQRVVLSCSQRPSDVLSRKKVKKEFIFQYLVNLGHVIDPKANKETIAKAVLKHWNSDDNCMDLELYTEEENKTSSVNTVATATDTVQELGMQFTSWFYDLLNKFSFTAIGSPGFIQGSPNQFGTSHLWNDCRLNLKCQDSHGNTRDVQCNSSVEVVQCLGDLVAGERLIFSPNLATGVKTAADVHGLVKVCVMGILHCENNCIGMFEQVFGLVRDALHTNNWKVKFTELVMHYNLPISS